MTSGNLEQLLEIERARAEEERRKTEEYLRDLQRIQADFINYKRRMEQEKAEQVKFANAMLILKLLPVLDDIERAVDTVQPELAGLNWVQGIALIERKFRSLLESEGLSPIPALGTPFDPNLHEAVVFEEGDEDEPVVVSVFQKGYKLGNRVIRPAMVKVRGKRVVASHLHSQDVTGNEPSNEPSDKTEEKPS